MRTFPWYVSVVLAIASYYGLKHGVGALLSLEQRQAGLMELLAPLVAMAWLLLAGKQLYDGVEPQNEDNEETEHQELPEDEEKQK